MSTWSLVPARCGPRSSPAFSACPDVITHLLSQDRPDWHSRAASSQQAGTREPGVGLGIEMMSAFAPALALAGSLLCPHSSWAFFFLHPRLQSVCPDWPFLERCFSLAWGQRERVGTLVTPKCGGRDPKGHLLTVQEWGRCLGTAEREDSDPSVTPPERTQI